MKILVTAGGTYAPIDKVRGLTNIFNGRTGIDIANHIAYNHEDTVVNLLLQKQSKWVNYMLYETPFGMNTLGGILQHNQHNYRLFHTYDDLYKHMEVEITKGNYDVVIHSAAVSDYLVEGTYVRTGISGDESGIIRNELVRLDDSGKIKSNFNDLFLHLVPTFKIIDKIRNEWNFQGILVKFKLEVGLEDEELIKIAKESRKQSGANIIVANCLEWANERAIVITEKNVTKIQRDLLPHYLYGEICGL